MVIEKHKVVALTYELKKDNNAGNLVEATTEDKPLVFLYGVGAMLPDFEANIAGKAVGETAGFGITAENAYGLHDETAVVNLPWCCGRVRRSHPPVAFLSTRVRLEPSSSANRKPSVYFRFTTWALSLTSA